MACGLRLPLSISDLESWRESRGKSNPTDLLEPGSSLAMECSHSATLPLGGVAHMASMPPTRLWRPRRLAKTNLLCLYPRPPPRPLSSTPSEAVGGGWCWRSGLDARENPRRSKIQNHPWSTVGSAVAGRWPYRRTPRRGRVPGVRRWRVGAASFLLHERGCGAHAQWLQPQRHLGEHKGRDDHHGFASAQDAHRLIALRQQPYC